MNIYNDKKRHFQMNLQEKNEKVAPQLILEAFF